MGRHHRIIYKFVRTLTRIIEVPEGTDTKKLAQEVANGGTSGHPRAEPAFNHEPDKAQLLEVRALDTPPPIPLPEAICSQCGSDNVKWAVWWDPKTKETGENFGSWNSGHNTYCGDCSDNTRLLVPGDSGFNDLWDSYTEAKKTL
jgi:hypothetical protein